MLPQTSSIPRRCERIYVRIPITLIVESEGMKVVHEAHTVDLSQRGVRVRSELALSRGQKIEVIPNEDRKYVVPGRVVWVGAAGSEQHSEAGLEFLQPLPTEP